MSINIQDYEQTLNGYKQQITNTNSSIATAERDLLITQTNLKNQEELMAQVEKDCQALTGKPITEIQNVIKDSMAQLEKTMTKVSEVIAITSNNPGSISDTDLQDAMQFTTEEL